MRAVPVAAVIATALLLSAQVQAQPTNLPAGATSDNTIGAGTPGTTPKDPAARTAAKGTTMAQASAPKTMGSDQPPATGMPKTAEQRDAAKGPMAAPMKPAPMTTGSDNGMSGPAGTPKTAEERTAAKEKKMSTRAAKKGARKAGKAPMASGGMMKENAGSEPTIQPKN